MKIILPAMSILMVLLLLSCKESETVTDVHDTQPQTIAVSDGHTAVVQEVIQGQSYTYLRVAAGDTIDWIATGKTEMAVGETIAFQKTLEMTNFTSKELERTFETIYFVGRIEKESALPASGQTPESPHQKPAVEKKDISIEPAKGGLSIAELFFNRDAYANKVVRIQGQVTKVNLSIMGKNWVHLQDGTGEAGSNDLLVTTQEKVTLGDIVTFEGTIALNKDFGSGYSYDVLMEEAKLEHVKK